MSIELLFDVRNYRVSQFERGMFAGSLRAAPRSGCKKHFVSFVPSFIFMAGREVDGSRRDCGYG